MGKSSFLIVVLMILSWSIVARESQYVVFLSDKANNEFSIDHPEEFLSPRAIQRKAKLNIPIDEKDLPVSREYLTALKEYEANVLFSSRWFNAALIIADEERMAEINSLAFVDSIKYVAPVHEVVINGRSGSSEYHATSRFRKKRSKNAELANEVQNRMLGVNQMHEDGYTGTDIMIAIFDSGFETVDESSFFNHLSENNQIAFTRDFVHKSGNVFQYDTHGTKALSTIAAYKENEYAGVAYDADFVLCVTENVASEFRIEEYNWLMAAELADSLGVDIINSSLAYTTFDDPDMDYTYEDLDGHTAIVTQAANIASKKGMIVVTSAGNDGNKSWMYINSPADADSVLAIGSVMQSFDRSSFSSFGPTYDGRIKPDLCALGSGVKVVTGENIGSSSGTSFSTPLIAGLTAGFWQAFPELSSFEVMEILRSSGSNSDAPDTLTGFGVPYFREAFEIASMVEEKPVETFKVYPNPVDGSRIIKMESKGFLEIGKVKVNFADLKGVTVKSLDIQVYNESEILEIDITDLIPGYYLVDFESNDDNKIVKLVVL